ncbi:MAG: hypothetical protein VXW42_08510 [Planctomycetota bacterium]|nr:hypothetical protein [Planctomycetota bacterium]
MQDSNQSDPPPDEPLCVCGYPKSGLPSLESLCPECGSTKLAVYKPSLSYTGWRLGTAGSYIAFIHLPLGFIVFTLLDAEDDLFHVPWLFMAMPLGVLSLLFTVISIRKREPKRRSLGNVSRALFAILFYPVALACVYALAQGA